MNLPPPYRVNTIQIHLVAMNAFLNGMKLLYVILVEQA